MDNLIMEHKHKPSNIEIAIESVVKGYLIKDQGEVLTVPMCIELSKDITETLMQLIEGYIANR